MFVLLHLTEPKNKFFVLIFVIFTTHKYLLVNTTFPLFFYFMVCNKYIQKKLREIFFPLCKGVTEQVSYIAHV